MDKKVRYHGNNMDKIMFRAVKITKKTVNGLHTGLLAGIGLGISIQERTPKLIELFKTNEGKIALKRFGAGVTTFFTIAGGAGAISQISQNIPEVSAAVVEEANNLDLNERYGKYDIDTNKNNLDNKVEESTNSLGEKNPDNVVTILHNADGSGYSQEVLEATGEKLEEEGKEYVYVDSNEELIKELQEANEQGDPVSVISVENNKNDGDKELISSSYVAGKDENNQKTPSEVLADSIVDVNPSSFYTAEGVGSSIVEGERTAGIAQRAIQEANKDAYKNGQPLQPVDTLITVRPTSEYNPVQLGEQIAEGIDNYYNENENIGNNAHRL